MAVGALFLALAFAAFVLGLLPGAAPFAFLSGALGSALCGVLGLRTAAAAAAAGESSGAGSWRIAFRAAAVTGLSTTAVGLLEASAWFAGLVWLAPRLGAPYSMAETTGVLLFLALGAAVHALLARLGGGMLSAAAAVGSDVLTRAEAGVPEDDPRNPAVTAARVGRSAAGVAGTSADLFASQGLAAAAAAILGVAAFSGPRAAPGELFAAAAFPFVVAGLGAALSFGWVLWVPAGGAAAPAALRRRLRSGAAVSAAALAALSGVAAALGLPLRSFGLWGAVVAGAAAAAVVARSAEYFAADRFDPARSVAAQSEAGTVSVLLGGLHAGLGSVWLPMSALVCAALAAYGLGGGLSDPAAGLYGVGLAAVGMAGMSGTIATAGACGPTAAGILDLRVQGGAREPAEALQALGGSVTAAARGTALGAAGLAALAALPACLVAASGAAPAGPVLAAGALLGAVTAFLFAGLVLGGVDRVGVRLVEECRRQWRTIPGLAALKPEARPDIPGCMKIAAASLQRQALAPWLLALAAPVAAGLLLGVAGVAGFAAGALVAGLPLAFFLGSSGWTWEAANRCVEGGRHGGRGSLHHQSALVGRLLGSPLRDLVGPGLGAFVNLTAASAVVVAILAVKLLGDGSLLERLAELLGGLAG